MKQRKEKEKKRDREREREREREENVFHFCKNKEIRQLRFVSFFFFCIFCKKENTTALTYPTIFRQRVSECTPPHLRQQNLALQRGHE